MTSKGSFRILAEAGTGGAFSEKTFSKFYKIHRPPACNFIKKRFWHRCYPVNFAKLSGRRMTASKSGIYSLKYLKTIDLSHFLNQQITGYQFKRSNSSRNICFSLFNCKQKQMHMFWVVKILCFDFSVMFGYQEEHAQSKWGCINALQSRHLSAGVKNYFYDKEISAYC